MEPAGFFVALMPTPTANETRDEFVDRCVPMLIDEGKRQDQAVAICNSMWENRDVDKSQLLAYAKAQSGRTGILTADRFVSSVFDCAGGACPNIPDGDWREAVKAAESKLVWTPRECEVKAAGAHEKAIATFDCIVTTPKRDRDRDILETKGATLDPKAPLLWQHMPMQPIGAVVGTLKHDAESLSVRCAIADTALGRDAAVLAEFGALRISHGFDPQEFEPLKGDEGWHIKAFEIFEVSLVSIPSNTDAVLTALSRGKLHDPLVKAWAQKFKDERRVQGIGASFRLKSGDTEIEYTAPDSEQLKSIIAANKGECSCSKDIVLDATIETIEPVDAKAVLDDSESGGEEAVPETRIGKAAKARLQSVNMYTLPGSWEHTENCLRETLRSYLSEVEAMKSSDCCGGCGCCDCGYSWVLGTFDGYAIVCFDGPAGVTLHRLAWTMTGDMPQWSGELQEVEIEVTAEIVEKSRAGHVSRLTQKTYADHERALFSATTDTSLLKQTHQRLGLVITGWKDQAAASEADELLDSLTL